MTQEGDLKKILIVDKVPAMRQALRAILEDGPFLVVDEASTWPDAIVKATTLELDLITIGLESEDTRGLNAIEAIMASHPIPILVLSKATTHMGFSSHSEALARGALYVAEKPSVGRNLDEQHQRLREACTMVSEIPVSRHIRAKRRISGATPRPDAARTVERDPLIGVRMIALGLSTGGPRALEILLGDLSPGIPAPMVIVQHMEDPFVESFVKWLNTCTPLTVQEAIPGDRPKNGEVYIAARGPHIANDTTGAFVAIPKAPGPHKPAVNVLFSSVAKSFGQHCLAILMTGMGSDGADGMEEIFDNGGYTIAQDETSSLIYGMPKAAVERGVAKETLTLRGIRALLRALA